MKNIKVIHFDESGYTGYNLLDPDQPIFSLASTDIDTELAEGILRESFPEYRGDEFKFSNLWRQRRQQKRLVNFAMHLGGLGDSAFIWMLDKQFVALTKVVDFLIEPVVTEAGYDFYADGFCWKYTNFIHFGLTQFGEPELLDRILAIYQNFSRAPSTDSLSDLQSRLGLMSKSVPDELKIFLEQMALGAALFEKYFNIDTFRSTNELHVTSMIASIGHWRKKYQEDFSVVHDASAGFFRHQELWDRITNNGVPRQDHPLGDGTFIEFPLRVVSTVPVDSKASYPVQFCDILAGLAAKIFASEKTEDEGILFNEIVDAGLSRIEYNGIRPSTIFPDHIPPRRLTGPDAVDKMTAIIFGPHNELR